VTDPYDKAIILSDGTANAAKTNANFYLDASDNVWVPGSLIPKETLLYSLGSTVQRWKDMFVGPGTINIAGPGDIEGTIGTNASGLIYTASGFAAPTVTVGPNLQSVEGAVGGWVLTAGGTAGTSSYDLLAQQGSTVAGGSAFGPLYSLIKQPTFQPISAFSGTLLVASFTDVSASILTVTIHPTLPNSYINLMANLDVTANANAANQIAYMRIDISGATDLSSTDIINYATGANSNNQLSHSLIQAYRYLVPTQDTTYTITMRASASAGRTFTVNHGHLTVFGNMF
jgi:hypothetical protein